MTLGMVVIKSEKFSLLSLYAELGLGTPGNAEPQLGVGLRAIHLSKLPTRTTVSEILLVRFRRFRNGPEV